MRQRKLFGGIYAAELPETAEPAAIVARGRIKQTKDDCLGESL